MYSVHTGYHQDLDLPRMHLSVTQVQCPRFRAFHVGFTYYTVLLAIISLSLEDNARKAVMRHTRKLI